MEIVVSEPIFTQKNTKGAMGQRYPHPTRLDKSIVACIHIYGTKEILLLFYDNQDTKPE